MKVDSVGWKVPTECESVQAFRISENKLEMEYYRGHMLVDIHIHRNKLTELHSTQPELLEEPKTCIACAKRSIHGITFSNGSTRGIHKACHICYLQSLQELKETYPEELTLEFL